MSARPLPPASGVLLVLDGWGHAPPGEGNALAAARTPVLDTLVAGESAAFLEASGEAVGLLPGTVGNSEIGHMVIGAGRPLPYDSLLVQQQIDSGAIATHPLLEETCRRLAASGGTLHLIGLSSDGQIHADLEHLAAPLAVAARHRLAAVAIHAITDGRDVPDGTATVYLERLAQLAADAGAGRIATVTGRGYAMDKAGNTELTDVAALAIADGNGAQVSAAAQAVEASARGDEWVTPSVVTDEHGKALGPIGEGDALLFLNFRSDRIQQLADHLLTYLDATGRRVSALSLAQYDTKTPIPALVGRADASGGLADELERLGLRSVRIAEAEKFEHVGYYINGRSHTVHGTEERVLVRHPGTTDYRARPEMYLDEVTDAVLAAAAREDVALVIANLANIDVVGHTGDYHATVKAAEHTDDAVARILGAARRAGRWVLLVGDHGNAETMMKTAPDGTTRPYGGHTLNPVPAVLVPADTAAPAPHLRRSGTLADIAPTVLALLGHPAPPAMTGRPLL
ncbi:2,3-bisphosphoglycerate-independent phosphoglycerate mutase [Kitasatospora sp. NPDC057965]|uniref:2,3-bisphosphoglycerate-independent phosphoglycerate mutase n=1 Tax=Kitasatospora sp. NPDC057965 TaxID=3346291 RepID=UPI0036D8E2CB